ncbi:MAG: prepilin-type N-terminal cleavage/methylation domain-containing protein [Crocinitomicaceae bacterium]|jgi:prepilin-type N-terminal cleavage/methylation domain-containing protein
MKNPLNSHIPPNRKAFTLIEMLVVVVIISTLLGIGAQVMKKATTAQGADTAASKAESLFAEARNLAKTSGSSVRVVIYKGGGTGEDRTKHLRYMGLVGQEQDADGVYLQDGAGNPDFKDQLKARGMQLPPKVFFNAKLSGDTELPTMDVRIPGFDGLQECYYYEFNDGGFLFVDPAHPADHPDPYGVFVVQSGTLYPTDDTPREAGNDSRDVGGFAIWKRGNTSMFRKPSQIPDLSATEDPKF